MRWAALEVDSEMAGKDLMNSVRLSGHICRILGAQQPEGFNYELFLDEKGEKSPSPAAMASPSMSGSLMRAPKASGFICIRARARRSASISM